MIDNEGADEFYIGNHGNFDRMAIAVLSELSETRAFRFYVVLAYLPAEKENPRADHAILPDGIENILTSSSPTSDIRGEEQPNSSYWQRRKTGESSKSLPKTQLPLRLFNSITHFSTCITSLFF